MKLVLCATETSDGPKTIRADIIHTRLLESIGQCNLLHIRGASNNKLKVFWTITFQSYIDELYSIVKLCDVEELVVFLLLRMMFMDLAFRLIHLAKAKIVTGNSLLVALLIAHVTKSEGK